MVKSTLARSRHSSPVASLQEQLQLALAIADEPILRSLLTDSLPALARPEEIGSIGIEVSVPVTGLEGYLLDGLIRFERVQCVLAGSQPDLPTPPPLPDHQSYQALTCCQSDLVTLAQNTSLSDAIALLSHAGFTGDQISQVLHLPSQAWHKSWWYMADAEGRLTIPFQRMMRVRHFGDGTLTLQYKDFYGYDRPTHFRGAPAQVPLVIRQPGDRFSEVLKRVNLARQSCASPQAILITEGESALETEGFMRQNISLFAPQQTLPLPIAANCRACQQKACPLQGQGRSPVLLCRAYAKRSGKSQA